MTYFTRFPLLPYTQDNYTTFNVVTDVLRRIAVSEQMKNNYTIYDEYDVGDGETPEIVSHRFYGTPDYHWVVLLINDILDPRYDWPLTAEQLYNYAVSKYGEDNVNAVHHYELSESDSTQVDNTQTKTTIAIADLVDLYQKAATGYIYATNNEQAFINYITQGTSANILTGNTISRGDINHSGNVNIGDAVYIDYYRFPNYPIPQISQSYISHINQNIIKPILENHPEFISYALENAPSFYLSERLAANAYVYYANTISPYYILSLNFRNDFIEYFGLGNTLQSNVANAVMSFLQEPINQKYLVGDLDADGYLSTVDVAYIRDYMAGNLSNSAPYYSNVESLFNTYLSGGISNFNYKVSSSESAFPDAVPVTNIEYEMAINDSKSRIRILKPQFLSTFVSEFEQLING